MPDESVTPPHDRSGCGQSCGCRSNGGSPPPANTRGGQAGVSRRSFIKTLGASAAATSLTATSESRATALLGAPAPGVATLAVDGPDPVEVTLNVNGKPMGLKVEPATTLLEALRLHLNLTGSKEICDRGACGGCSVLVDGKLVNSCMMLALDAVGAEVTTVEGLARDGQLDPVQESFVRHDSLQCGYCTPGLVMACRALLNETPRPTLDQIKRGLSGNICRCGTYTNVFNAALEASGQDPIMDQRMEGA
ncbi:MAG: (2Fe-2S)-binding protein [Phycisphaerales bacterium]